MKNLIILIISCLILSATCLIDKEQSLDLNDYKKVNVSEKEVPDLTDPKMSQCLTDLTGYKNIDQLMDNVYREFLVANNLTVVAKETMNSLIGYQTNLENPVNQQQKIFGIRWYCCRRRKFLRWWICVRWCFIGYIG